MQSSLLFSMLVLLFPANNCVGGAKHHVKNLLLEPHSSGYKTAFVTKNK